MKILDLFCGEGGASWGYFRYFQDKGIKAQVTGIDIIKQKKYPFCFIKVDVFALDHSFLNDFDLIHASPPCQAFSRGTAYSRSQGRIYPNLIPDTLNFLANVKVPVIIENVPGSPIRPDIILSGVNFGLPLIRRRWFQLTNCFALSPYCPGSNSYLKPSLFYTLAGAGDVYNNKYSWSFASGNYWMSKKGLRQSIPWLYTHYICVLANF